MPRGGVLPPPTFKKRKICKKNAFKIMKISTSYFYLASLLEEEFHGLCKAYNIKSELKYGRDLERR